MPFLSENGEVYPPLHDLPVQDYNYDVVPLMEYYPSVPLYETLALEPTPSLQGYIYVNTKNMSFSSLYIL